MEQRVKKKKEKKERKVNVTHNLSSAAYNYQCS